MECSAYLEVAGYSGSRFFFGGDCLDQVGPESFFIDPVADPERPWRGFDLPNQSTNPNQQLTIS